MLRKTRHIDGRGGHDNLEVRASRQQLLQIAQQKINVEAALVGFVDDQRVVSAEIPVMGQLGQQNAVGHQLNGAGIRDRVIKADLITHQAAQRRVEFIGDALRHRACGNSPGLGVTNTLLAAAAKVQTDFGELGGFTRASLARENDHLMIANRRLDIGTALRDRQLFREIDLCRYLAFGHRLGSTHESMPGSVEIAQLTSQNLAHRSFR